MFPPPFSSRSAIPDGPPSVTQAYQDVILYGDMDGEDVLYEGPIVVHPTGWIELEGNRLLSPTAIHHITIFDDERDQRDSSERTRGNTPDDDSGGGTSRTNRFRP